MAANGEEQEVQVPQDESLEEFVARAKARYAETACQMRDLAAKVRAGIAARAQYEALLPMVNAVAKSAGERVFPILRVPRKKGE